MHSFTDVYADDVKILEAQISGISGNANDGVVSGTRFSNAMWVRRYSGTSSQTVDWILNNRYPSVFTSNFRGRGITYAANSFDWGDGKLYQGPPIMTYVVRGKKCYDPRLDSSPGANPTNASYIAWTNNPALCWADYLMADYGGLVGSTNIDWASVVTAADICEESVNVPSGTQRRYTFNGRIILPIDPDWRENAKIFVDAMLGRMVRRDGKWFVYAGAWEAASYTVNKTDWLSIERIRTVAPRDGGRWNTVRCWYVDETRNWQRVECFPRRNSTYKSADGAEEITLEMEQPACNNEYEAQRKAELMLRQSRNQIAVTGRLPPRFRKMATGEVVAVNFDELGWVSKLMRIRSMDMLPDGSVNVGLVEEQEADWADLDSSEYNQPSTASAPATNPTTPSAATLSVTNSVNGTIRFVMANPTVRPVGTRFQIIRTTASNDASVGTVVYDGLTQTVDLSAPISGTFYYHSRTYAGSYFGPYSPNTSGLLATAYATNVFQVNCTATQTFSKAAGAFFGQEIGRTDFAPTSAGAAVSVTATFRAGVGNVFATNGVYLQFVTGVSSSYVTPSVPNGGTTTDLRPTQITGVFTYTANNSAYVALQWDTTSGPNSVVIDNVALRTEFIRL